MSTEVIVRGMPREVETRRGYKVVEEQVVIRRRRAQVTVSIEAAQALADLSARRDEDVELTLLRAIAALMREGAPETPSSTGRALPPPETEGTLPCEISHARVAR